MKNKTDKLKRTEKGVEIQLKVCKSSGHVSRRAREIVRELLTNEQLSEHMRNEMLNMHVGRVKMEPPVGCVCCLALPEYLMEHIPCSKCMFNVMPKEWCLKEKFCMSNYRPDHLGVYFKKREKTKEEK